MSGSLLLGGAGESIPLSTLRGFLGLFQLFFTKYFVKNALNSWFFS